MLSDLKLFNDEGMPKLKKDELECVQEGLHVTSMTKVVQALLRLDSAIDLISVQSWLLSSRVMSHRFFFFF